MVNKITLVMTLMLSGCANYHFGDISKSYCYSTSKEFRAGIKATLNDKGVSIGIGIDYCLSVGLADALIIREHETNGAT